MKPSGSAVVAAAKRGMKMRCILNESILFGKPKGKALYGNHARFLRMRFYLNYGVQDANS